MIADKQDMLFERDEDGSLLPKVVELEIPSKDKVKILPLTRAEIKKTLIEAEMTDEVVDKDGEVIKKKCIDPKFTDEEIKFMKPYYALAIMKAIMKASGLIPPEKDKTSLDSAQLAEEDLKKI